MTRVGGTRGERGGEGCERHLKCRVLLNFLFTDDGVRRVMIAVLLTFGDLCLFFFRVIMLMHLVHPFLTIKNRLRDGCICV
jgi:hypothetical protein